MRFPVLWIRVCWFTKKRKVYRVQLVANIVHTRDLKEYLLPYLNGNALYG